MRWILEFEIDESWVADGFDFDEERCRDLEESLIAYAYPSEVSVKVLSAPDLKEILRIQGHETTNERG